MLWIIVMTGRIPFALASFALVAALAGCAPDYSPNTYNPGAVQQAAKVDRGMVVGFRQVAIRADGTVGAVTGGAAGGLVGSQVPGGGFSQALGALGGTVIGGLVGASAEREADDTDAWEYIVRQTDGSLLSVTQKDKTPLKIGEHVLVIAGKQARIVPDYTVNLPAPPKPMPPSPPVAAASLPPLTGAVTIQTPANSGASATSGAAPVMPAARPAPILPAPTLPASTPTPPDSAINGAAPSAAAPPSGTVPARPESTPPATSGAGNAAATVDAAMGAAATP